MRRGQGLVRVGIGGCVLVVLLVVPAAGASSASSDDDRLHAAGRWLVDGQGRAVILHGVNQVRKLPPYLPSAIGFGADDAAAIADLGFNTVRTGVHHAGLAPAPGEYDTAYLDDFAATVEALTDEGLYVLVDFHHDMYNERYQGNGFADWATVDSVPGDPTTLPMCNLGFPGNYFACPALWEANDRFYGLAGRSPEVGPRGRTLQDEFAHAWEQVAARLRDDPLVFGFNILNEPTPGSQVLACLNPTGCPPPTDQRLKAFQDLVGQRIRSVAPDTMVFYEPWATNFNAGFPTHHGDLAVDDAGFSFHVYACPFAIPGVPVPDPGLAEHCDDLREQTVFDNAEAQAREHGDPPLLTEFGATDDLATIDRVADLADANRMGWQYWSWWNEDPCCERPEEGVIDHPSNPPTPDHLKQDKLDVLARPYPRAVAGTPTSWHWDPAAGRFSLAYTTEAVGPALAPGATTEVWVGQRHFPDGYRVVDLQGGRVVSRDDADVLRVAATASEVSLAVVADDGSVPATDTDDGGAAGRTETTAGATGRAVLPATGGGAAAAALAVALGVGLRAASAGRRGRPREAAARSGGRSRRGGPRTR